MKINEKKATEVNLVPRAFPLKNGWGRKNPGDEVGQRSRARDKKQKRRYFFVGRTTRKFCSGGDKMRNATGHQCKVKISCTEKKGTRTRTKFPPKKRVTKKFLKVSLCNLAKQRQKMYKKVCCTCKVAFLLITPIVVFTVLRRCLRRLALHDFIFC